jgi:hypothetical protein
MFAILHVLWIFVVDIFKSRRRLEAENLFLHDQLNIALRRASPRLRLYGIADSARSARHIPGREAGNHLAMASLRLQSAPCHGEGWPRVFQLACGWPVIIMRDVR